MAFDQRLNLLNGSSERSEIADAIEFGDLCTQLLNRFVGILWNHRTTCDTGSGERNL